MSAASDSMQSPATGSGGASIALKEWAAVAHALLDGRQTVLLRKGGIHEKAFRVEGDPGGFVLFPTTAHSHRARVRPEHAELLDVGQADVSDRAVTVRCGVSLVDVVEVARPGGLEEVADLHIWTAASVREDRLEFRPRHPLLVLVVRAVALPEPVEVPRLEAYGGCRSWVELPVAWDGGSGRPTHDDARLAEDAARVRAAVA